MHMYLKMTKYDVFEWATEYFDIAISLIDKGIHIRSFNDNFLKRAVYFNNLDMVQYAIQNGANIHITH